MSNLDILFIVGAYLIGAIPAGYVIAKRLGGIDIRKHGSGNPGAANVFRVVGMNAGMLTLVFDMLKGFLPVLLAVRLTAVSATAVSAAAPPPSSSLHPVNSTRTVITQNTPLTDRIEVLLVMFNSSPENLLSIRQCVGKANCEIGPATP